MDQQFSNILRGTRQFFQGVPTSTTDTPGSGGAPVWPYQLFPGVGSGSITRGTSDSGGGGGGERPTAAYPPQQMYVDRAAAAA